MIYGTAATSGPALRLLKGCPSSSRRWSLRCPCFRQRCGVKLAVGSDERCGRLLECCRHECARPADFLIGLSWLAWPLRLRCSSHSLFAVTALRAAPRRPLIQDCTRNAASKRAFFISKKPAASRENPQRRPRGIPEVWKGCNEGLMLLCRYSWSLALAKKRRSTVSE